MGPASPLRLLRPAASWTAVRSHGGHVESAHKAEALRHGVGRWRELLLRLGLAAILALASSACEKATPVVAGSSADVRSLTGAHTRLVWVQGDGTDPFAIGDQLLLMGLDTDDRAGERAILAERRSYMKPLLAENATRVVFSSRRSPGAASSDIFVVNWDGSGLRRLTDGFALHVWRDPADGRDWVYAGRDRSEETFASVVRFVLDQPEVVQPVWNKTPVNADNFQVSTNGREAAGLFPWPEVGLVELPNGSRRTLGEGCWTSFNDLGPRLFWYFDGAHRNLSLVDLDSDRRWRVPINTAPGFEHAETYHPRWTNHPRFLAITGPYNRGGQNQARSGGAQTEVWLGRFSPDYSSVEEWARATSNDGGDSYPDVWVDPRRTPHRARPTAPVGAAPSPSSASGAATGSPERITIAARLVRAGTVPSPRSIAPYRHALVANLYEVVEVVEGAYAPRTILVAQWAIRDAQVLSDARKTPGTVYRFPVELYDAHPELEGERLLIDQGTGDLRLFYDVTPR